MLSKIDFERLIEQLPEASVEKQILRCFDGLKEHEILFFIYPYLINREGKVLQALVRILVKKLNKQENLLKLMGYGFEKQKLGEIGYWLRIILPKLDEHRFIMLCTEQSQEMKEMVRYHIGFVEADAKRRNLVALWEMSFNKS